MSNTLQAFNNLFQLSSNNRSLFQNRRNNQLRRKVVYELDCVHCKSTVCHRGLRAILLSNTKVELYSTDRPIENVQMVENDYTTDCCKCNIRDLACKGCGNVIGYHVTQPCTSCMEAKNNGHFWMFFSNCVASSERESGGEALMWTELVPFSEDYISSYEQYCR